MSIVFTVKVDLRKKKKEKRAPNAVRWCSLYSGTEKCTGRDSNFLAVFGLEFRLRAAS